MRGSAHGDAHDSHHVYEVLAASSRLEIQKLRDLLGDGGGSGETGGDEEDIEERLRKRQAALKLSLLTPSSSAKKNRGEVKEGQPHQQEEGEDGGGLDSVEGRMAALKMQIEEARNRQYALKGEVDVKKAAARSLLLERVAKQTLESKDPSKRRKNKKEKSKEMC